MKGRIFITGGTGSLGRAIVERAKRGGGGCEFTIYSRDEVKQHEMHEVYPDCRYVLGDVRDTEWMALAMRGHHAVIHAAAYKRVPEAEVHVGEAVESNVIGSRNVARAAIEAGVPRVLGISTDKSCTPINVYGASKMLMERLFQGYSLLGRAVDSADGCHCERGPTQFNLIRYGNVLNSRGSVVPLFRQQMREGKPITITGADMTRFWMTIEDAVDLVEMGLAETESGTILIPKCGASTMAVLAEAAASGAQIKVIGARPGDKLHEILLHAMEATHADDIGGHFRVFPAYSGYRGNLPAGYEYRSDIARQLSARDLMEMLYG